jgi:hypothetical protein
MRLSPFFAATVAALVVITWFLWPFAAVPKDPVGSALAAVRALIFFLVTLGATNVVAGHLPVPLRPVAPSGIAFGIAFAIGAGVSIGLNLFVAPRPSFNWRSQIISVAIDAFWCSAATLVYYLLAAKPSTPHR